jgi:hypothetical protein
MPIIPNGDPFGGVDEGRPVCPEFRYRLVRLAAVRLTNDGVALVDRGGHLLHEKEIEPHWVRGSTGAYWELSGEVQPPGTPLNPKQRVVWNEDARMLVLAVDRKDGNDSEVPNPPPDKMDGASRT